MEAREFLERLHVASSGVVAPDHRPAIVMVGDPGAPALALSPPFAQTPEGIDAWIRRWRPGPSPSPGGA
jgi:hypothetical protein